MITVSLCMIVRNEEATLSRCLDSVRRAVDEIVIVDTGSTDATIAIAETYTERVIRFPWIDDFSAARNESFRHAACDYILWLDADDVLALEDTEKLLELKSVLGPAVDSVTMPYLLASGQEGRPVYSLRRNRLVKRSRQFRWIGCVHEYLEVSGTVLHSGIAVRHQPVERPGRSERNLAIYRKKLESGSLWTPRDRYYYANELQDHGLWGDAAEQYEYFLSEGLGWEEDCIQACGKLADCYLQLGRSDRFAESALRSLKYGAPRAEHCCRLGYHFLREGRLDAAVFWYESAARLERPDSPWAILNHACWTWLPHLQLCVCLDRLGRYGKAYEHNEQALAYLPEDPRMLANRAYLQGKLKA
ncbi:MULTISPECIES: glycosyltransferase [Paenibacillus]|uniref:glycosyltransferase n=1 Tax=Paenibacillus TaxID=44249 RepID=UPI0022B8697A|nr:glycosyltransferase [Paenibacillus caseinilyticus]MCZ8518563.1 glycosyltransferase [Paenibacillus caseinilyticus]